MYSIILVSKRLTKQVEYSSKHKPFFLVCSLYSIADQSIIIIVRQTMWIKTEIKAEGNLKLLPSCLKQQHCYQNCSFIKKKTTKSRTSFSDHQHSPICNFVPIYELQRRKCYNAANRLNHHFIVWTGLLQVRSRVMLYPTFIFLFNLLLNSLYSSCAFLFIFSPFSSR